MLRGVNALRRAPGPEAQPPPGVGGAGAAARRRGIRRRLVQAVGCWFELLWIRGRLPESPAAPCARLRSRWRANRGAAVDGLQVLVVSHAVGVELHAVSMSISDAASDRWQEPCMGETGRAGKRIAVLPSRADAPGRPRISRAGRWRGRTSCPTTAGPRRAQPLQRPKVQGRTRRTNMPEPAFTNPAGDVTGTNRPNAGEPRVGQPSIAVLAPVFERRAPVKHAPAESAEPADRRRRIASVEVLQDVVANHEVERSGFRPLQASPAPIRTARRDTGWPESGVTRATQTAQRARA